MVIRSHSLWYGESVSDMLSSASNSGVEAINVEMRRRALVRLRIACTSWRTDLGQRWWGEGFPFARGACF